MACLIDCSYIFNQICKKLDKLENYFDNILINCFKIKQSKDDYKNIVDLEEVKVTNNSNLIDNEDYTLL